MNSGTRHCAFGGGKAIALILLISALMVDMARAEVDFDYLHGSDLGMGIGARAISMSGAFTAVADGAAVYDGIGAGVARTGGHCPGRAGCRRGQSGPASIPGFSEAGRQQISPG